MDIELPVHETTGLQALGFTKNNRPIWPVFGGSEDGGTPGGAGGDGGSGGNGDGNGNPAGGSEDNPPEITPDNSDAKKANDAANKWRARADKDKADAKAAQQQLADLQNKTQAQLDAIAVAVGLKKEEATPEQLQQALTESSTKISEATAKAKAAEIKLGAFTAAAKVDGADASKLLDSIAFMEAANKLDPASDSFGKDMEKLVKEKTPKPEGGSGYSTPVGGGAGSSTGNNETDPRKLADRISRGGYGIRPL